MIPSALEDLRVWHRPRKSDVSGIPPTLDRSDFFYVATCQRELWITCNAKPSITPSGMAEYHTGVSGYQFLLEISCGLKSLIKGETDVFGQIKSAWHEYEQTPVRFQPWIQKLKPWMQRLFEDTKWIRSEYLHGHGGHSYGSICRMLLQPKNQDRILVLGAGQIAASVLPYFLDFDVFLWNRSPEHAHTLVKRMKDRQPNPKNLTVVSDLPHINMNHLLLCVPPKHDSKFSNYLENAIKNSVGKIIHLGAYRADRPFKNSATSEKILFLDDVFRAQREQSDTRERHYALALRACHERSLLRSLDGTITTPHGWEDLALFTSAG